MLKTIRPTGFAAFTVIAVALLVFWFFAAGWAVKTAVEEGGSAIVGAKVELGDADVSFSPFGVTLHTLQITNPEQPMENLMQADRIRATLSLPELLMGNVVIEELSGDGVRLSVARSYSGALQKKVRDEKPDVGESEGEAFSFGQMPTADELMEREPLSTLELSDKFKAALENHKVSVNGATDKLPDDVRLQEYQSRITALKGEKIESLDDLAQRKKTLDEIKDAIRQDKQALVDAREAIQQAKSQLGDGIKQLKLAPSADWDRIQSKYGFSPESLANFSRLLFGNEVAQWVEKLQPWIAQIERNLDSASDNEEAPPPPRGEGRFIHFAAQGRTPSFLIRDARLTVNQLGGDIGVSMKNVTHEPDVLGEPLVFDVLGEELKGIERITAKGVVDFRDANQPKASIDWRASGWGLSDFSLMDSSDMGLALQQAQLQTRGSLQFIEARLEGESRSQFQQVAWKGDGEHGLSIASDMQSIDQFNIDVGVSGRYSAPDFDIRSDLDQRMKSVMSARFKERQAALEQRFKSRLEQKIAAVSEPYERYKGELEQRQAQIKQRITSLESMLNEEIKAGVESQKETAKDRLKDKFKGLGL